MKKVLTICLVAGLMLAIGTAQAATVVDLGTAGNFAILAKSGVSTTSGSTVLGDIGVSPSDSTSITGFGLIMDSTNTFSTSSLVTGKVYAADYTAPTPTYMTTAISDMATAYTDAAGRAAFVTELGAGNIGGMTLAPNVYKWSSGVTIPTNLTLLGGADDVWIFQIAGTLGISSATQVILSGGAQAGNIFWQVAGQATLGTTSQFSGNILGQTAIVMLTGATLNGRAMAQTAVTLDNVSVVADGLSDECGDELHPYPAGDFNFDCMVNEGDLNILAQSWLQNSSSVDMNDDGVIDLEDFSSFADVWLECTYNCN